MFYIGDGNNKKDKDGGYVDKTEDEITQDLLRIMDSGFDDSPKNAKTKKNSPKKEKKFSSGNGMIQKNDFRIGRSRTQKMFGNDDFTFDNTPQKTTPKNDRVTSNPSKSNDDEIFFQNIDTPSKVVLDDVPIKNHKKLFTSKKQFQQPQNDHDEDEFPTDEDSTDEDDDENEIDTSDVEGSRINETLEDPIDEMPSKLTRVQDRIPIRKNDSLTQKTKSDSKNSKNFFLEDSNIKGPGKLKRIMKSPRKIALGPVPKDEGLVHCYILRQKGKFTLYPKYFLYVEREEGDIFLLAAVKRRQNKTSNYCVCTEKKVSRKSKAYVGKLRSNMLGTKFYIFDNGASENKRSSRNPLRNQMAAVLYESNILGTRGPRKMTVLIPRVENGKYLKMPDIKEGKLIEVYQKTSDWSDFTIYKNKGPSWNEDLKAYVLNFNGRVTKPSVKNFQLVNPQSTDVVALQFGRIAENKFTLDFRWPVSPFQAFCVALSAFDFKIGCE